MRSGPGRKRAAPLIKTAAALGALAGIVWAVDSLPLMQAARAQLWSLGSLHHAEFDRKLPARRNLEVHVGVGSGKLRPELTPPRLEPAGGVFAHAIEVEAIAHDSDSVVHCTFDGSIPTHRHDPYAGPIRVTASLVVRCRAFRPGFQPSPATTQTYLIDPPGALPALAIAIDPTNLSNKYTGIYARFREKGDEWERDAHVEYMPRDGSLPLRIPGRIRVHGFYSRGDPKKSLRFYYASFPQSAHDPGNILTWPSPQRERVVVFGARERRVSRDELFQKIYSGAGGLAPANMPVFVYVNAQPWGIYYVRERIDEEFLERRVGRGRYDLLDAQPGKPRVLAGDRKHWDRTISFFERSDLSDPQAFAAAAELIDLDNFTDYWLFNIYAANRDWPHHNMNMFRRRDGGDGRWRWISWDADATFDFMGKGLAHDTLAWATRSQLRHDLRLNSEAGLRDNEGMFASTLIARKLLENPAYRRRFADRMAALLEAELHPERITSAIETMHDAIAKDLAPDWERWAGSSTADALAAQYCQDLKRVKTFATERPAVIRSLFSSLAAGT